MHLNEAASVVLEASPPYSLALTVHKPAGWWWSTPDEKFEEGMLWTATRLRGSLVGLKLQSAGTQRNPKVKCVFYTAKTLQTAQKQELFFTMQRALRTKEGLSEFYAFAQTDEILKETIKDLCGMQTVGWPELFPALILAVTLQMAPMKRSNQMMDLLLRGFGETAEFDHKEVLYWPSTKTIAQTAIDDLQVKTKLGYRATNLVAIAKTLEEGFPSMNEIYAMEPEEAKKKLMALRGIGEYSADLVVPGMGFPLDVWSAKIFSVLFHSKLPIDPREAISDLKKIAEKRWGKWAGYAFVYVLNDLSVLSKKVGFDLTRF